MGKAGEKQKRKPKIKDKRQSERLAIEDDPAWAEWKAALDQVNSTAQALRRLRGSPETAMENMEARVAFEAALGALARAAKKIAHGGQ
jgi:hypothetical protein